jgi:hypothetical protein
MTTYPKPNPATHVIPQVGAILHLDTTLSHPGAELGNKHWMLDGSCVLVAPDRILTVRHTLGKTALSGAFFPYEGIVPIEDERMEDYTYGDTVCLCRLKWAVRYSPPMHYDYTSRTKLHSAVVAGFGMWNRAGWEQDGIQRSSEVELHMPGKEDHERYGDNLDICWWSPWNDGLRAERNNSGGPLLLREIDGHTLLGLNRETKQDQQAASRITRERLVWLDGELDGVSCRPIDRPVQREAGKALSLRHDGWACESFEVPLGATKVHATLSATPGLRLQMGFAEPGEEEWLRDRVKQNDENSGRFLYRCEPLPAGISKLIVGVAPVAAAPARAESADAQLCCMFT